MTTIQDIIELKPDSIFKILPESIFDGCEYKQDIENGDAFEYYTALTRYYKPNSILEIGVLHGFSLMSMIAGCINKIKTIDGIDSEAMLHNSNSIASWNIYNIFKIIPNLWTIDSISISKIYLKYDIIHIDGDHNFINCLHDLNLAANNTNVILIDDYLSHKSVREACDTFIKNNKIKNSFVLPKVNGLFVIEMNV